MPDPGPDVLVGTRDTSRCDREDWVFSRCGGGVLSGIVESSVRDTGTTHRFEEHRMNPELLSATARAMTEERLRSAQLRREARVRRAEARRRERTERRAERFGRAA